MSANGAYIQPLDEDDPERLGTFPLIGRLGEGGMGRVYLGRSLTDGELVAIKSPLADAEQLSPTDRKRFAREVRLASRAAGVRTARVLGADAEAARPWLATEYIPAPSLAELVICGGPLTGTAAQWVTRGTLEAVAELHGQGIVHRDVKPHNLLLPLDGPRLIDFGISHATDLTRTQLTLGTVAFASPEQARGEASTPASDIYSLGATLFHLAVGRAPYPPDIEMLPLLMFVAEARVDLTGLPDELGPVVRDCLALDPDDRPQATDLLERFTFELAEMPTVHGAAGWLPATWTRIIEAYASQGRELTTDPGAGVRMAVDKHTLRQAERDGIAATRLPPSARTALLADRMPAPATTAYPADAARDAAHDEPPEETDPPTVVRRGRGERYFVRAVQVITASVLLLIVGGLAYANYRVEQLKELDETDSVFAEMSIGDCVSTARAPDGRWLSPTPEQTDCLADDADWRVVGANKNQLVDRCGGPYGAETWTRNSSAGTFSLCLERIFREGECVLGAEPAPEGDIEVIPLVGNPVFATTVNCSDQAPVDHAVMRVTDYVESDAGCPEQARVRYKFSERGRLLCLTPA